MFAPILITFAAFLMRVFNLSTPKGLVFDEVYYVDGARDDLKYGGSGVTNTEIVVSNEELHGYAAQTTLRLPPLATIWLELQI